MCCCLYFSDWLHKSVSHHDADVGAGEPVCPVRKAPEVGLHQVVRRLSQIQSEQMQSSRLLGQGNVNSLLKSIGDTQKSFVTNALKSDEMVPGLLVGGGAEPEGASTLHIFKIF